MGQITATRNLVATKVVRHAGQQELTQCVVMPHGDIELNNFGSGNEKYYWQTSNISHTLVGNKIVDHTDVVGASLVGIAPTTSSFST